MKNLRKPLALLLLLTLCLTALAGCESANLRAETELCKLSYDEDGFPVITFNSAYSYPHYELPQLSGFTETHLPQTADYASEMNSLLQFQPVDSLYLIKIIKPLTEEEARNIPGYKANDISDRISTFYEAVLVYDFLRGEPLQRSFYLRRGGTADCQIPGRPPHAAGDTLVAVLGPQRPDSAIQTPAVITLSVLSDSVSGDTFVFNHNTLYADISQLSVKMSDVELTAPSDYEGNRWVFTQKFRLGDLVDFIKSDWTNRGLIK